MVSKKSGKRQTFGLQADTSQRNSTSFGTALALVRMSMGGLCSTEDFTSSTGFSDFLIFSTTVDN